MVQQSNSLSRNIFKLFTHYQWAIRVAAATWSVVWWQVSAYLLQWFVTISWKSEFLIITLTTPVTSALNFNSNLSLRQNHHPAWMIQVWWLQLQVSQNTFMMKSKCYYQSSIMPKTFLASWTSTLTAGMPPPANLLCFRYTLQSSTTLWFNNLWFNNPLIQQSFDSTIVRLKSLY